MDEYGFEETVILYDLTNTYFEGSKRGSKVARHGKSKERRNDCPILTLSLTVDEEGFPKQSKVFEGNVSEPDTLKDIVSGLKKEDGLFSSERTIVMDAGIATEDNIALIKKSGYTYVAVSRKRSYEDAFWSKADEEKMALSDGKTTLSMKFVRTEEEAFLLCHSEAKEAKGKAILFRKEQRFEQGLLAIKEGLAKVKRQKKVRQDYRTHRTAKTVLTYHMLAGILKKLRTAGVHHTWNTMFCHPLSLISLVKIRGVYGHFIFRIALVKQV